MEEEKTIKLVKELANTLENVAVGPLHTPRLYSTFLKAVIASKTGVTVNGEREGFDYEEPSEAPTSPSTHTSPSIHTSPAASIQSPHLQPPPQQHVGAQMEVISPNLSAGELVPTVPPPLTNGFYAYDFYPFQNDGEMGPAVDITTFPPTMADQDQAWPPVSVENIFAQNFWDNVLVPGVFDFTTGLLTAMLFLRVFDTPRNLGLSGRSLWWFRVWLWYQRVDHSRIRDS
jgi:hypothetical protein